MRTSLIARAAVVALALVAATVATSAQQAGARIAAHDRLKITVFGESALTGPYLVDADGGFDYPYIGRVKAEGLTAREVAAEIKKRLQPDYLLNPQVTVDLEQSTSKHVNIVGEVRSPGEYPFAGQITVLQALAKAGSVSENAAEEAFLYRAAVDSDPPDGQKADKAPIVIDLHDLLNGGSLKNDLALDDGDEIVVPKVQPVYVTGYVKAAGAYPVPRGTTVQQVIARAGGVSDKGTERGVKIDRVVNGKKVTIGVKDIKTEVVKPGDTVIVSARIF
jgi:polysaccharide export outer membrane protein